MRSWTMLLGGLVVWAVHFFALYIVASIFFTTLIARTLTLLVSLACLGANGLLLRWVIRADPSRTDRWIRTMAKYSIALSTLAILWQALPAILI
ncbi:hypothetical protein ACQKO5_20050 [Novosphingobium subterraneum]|uniref:hypothetical protein n=1 Tax=Novosphingobium subterraneum TaxID=48936 RepID=UPI003D03B4D5